MNRTHVSHRADETPQATWTSGLKSRIRTRDSGVGCKYSRTRIPVELAKFFQDQTFVAGSALNLAMTKVLLATIRAAITTWLSPDVNFGAYFLAICSRAF